jgi:hypothetical protein
MSIPAMNSQGTQPRNPAGRWTGRLLVLFLAPAVLPQDARACNSRFFVRGDADCSSSVGVADAILILDFLFKGFNGSRCPDAADANDDGRIDMVDPVRILMHFHSGAPLPAPGPEVGEDPTSDGLPCVTMQECPDGASATLLGEVSDPRVSMPSGIVVSRRDPDLMWVVNDFDSGQDPTLYALSRSGATRAAFTLCVDGSSCPPGPAKCVEESFAEVHCDWEGLALGPGERGRDTLFIGDIGDNRFTGADLPGRSIYWIHRIDEARLAGLSGDGVLRRDQGDFDTLFFRYPEPIPGVDAEVLLSDPLAGDLYIVAAFPRGRVYRYAHPQRPAEVVTLEVLPVGFSGNFHSGGDISPLGRHVVLKAGGGVEIFPWIPGDLRGAYRDVCRVRLPFEDFPHPDQPERFHAGAVAFDTEGSLFSVEEYARSQIFRVELDDDGG